jgi:succinate dehydrogenase / fumarate reductase iron-sulfur subunit
MGAAGEDLLGGLSTRCRVRRYQPESGEGPYWDSFDVELDESLSVLDGILQARDREDGSLSVRCSCRAAICGSCGVKINGSSTLACKTQIGEAHAAANSAKRRRDERTARRRRGSAARAPVGPTRRDRADGEHAVIKDLVTDMESTHWRRSGASRRGCCRHGRPPSASTWSIPSR